MGEGGAKVECSVVKWWMQWDECGEEAHEVRVETQNEVEGVEGKGR